MSENTHDIKEVLLSLEMETAKKILKIVENNDVKLGNLLRSKMTASALDDIKSEKLYGYQTQTNNNI